MSTNKLIPFKEQIKSLPIEDLWRVEHTVRESPNLQAVNPLSKQLVIATIREEIQARGAK